MHIPQAIAMAAGPYHWFLNTLVRVHVSCEEGTDNISYIEHHVRKGESPPLHNLSRAFGGTHEREDEIFHLVAGDFTFRQGDAEVKKVPGDVVFIPKGTPHTFRCDSATGHFFSITTGRDFEHFLRAMWRPAERDELPSPAAPTSADIEALGKAAAAHHMPVVEPPLM
ncbi:MAG TPA: cupin domain-containing protein [Flavobacteriales bacterium]|nr:cupin domain-containing protein [Flavobacteriales bacterium]